MTTSDSICFRCSSAYKKQVEETATEKGYKSTSDYAKDCISKDMYNKQPPTYKNNYTTAIHSHGIAESKTTYTSTPPSRAQILTKLAENSEAASIAATQVGDHAAAKEHLEASIEYYKQLLSESTQSQDKEDEETVLSTRTVYID